MNKRFLFAATVASIVLMTVAGCSGDEVIAEQATSASNAIGFNILGSNASLTRAMPTTNNNLQEEDFEVVAYLSGATDDATPFMGKQPNDYWSTGIPIAWDDTKWTYKNTADQAYWPKDAVNFYAVHPTTISEGSSNPDAQRYLFKAKPDTQTISYATSDEFGNANNKNLDVMYAMALDQTKETNAGTVKMTFKHALCQVLFKAKTAQPSLKVEIKDMYLSTLSLGGTFTFPADAATAGSWTPNAKVGSSDQKHGTIHVRRPYDPTSNNVTVTVEGTDALVWLSQKDNVGGEEVLNPLMLIPQTLTSWNPKSKPLYKPMLPRKTLIWLSIARFGRMGLRFQ